MMLKSLKTPSMNRPADGWTDRQITYAKGIVANTPDLDRSTHRKLRIRQLAVFALFIAAAFVLALIHIALLIPMFIASFFLLDFGFEGYGNAQKQLAWARQVLDETEDESMPDVRG